MSTYLSSQPMPSLFSIALTDWLPKLGEKAFLAWLRMHSWRTEQGTTEPVQLPLSLNRIIKRLKVGNSTFYDHILRPLWNYGLIDLKPAAAGQKHQLIVYSYPLDDPMKSSNPLLQIRDYDLSSPQDLASHSLSTLPAQEEDLIENHQDNAETQENILPSSNIHEALPRPTSSTTQKEIEIEQVALTTTTMQTDTLPQLPPNIQAAIHSDSKLQVRAGSILQVYLRFKEDPRFSNEFFLHKIQTCVRYSHDPRRFAAYLNKAIRNEWAKKDKPTPHSPSRPHDIPEWIWKQQEREKQATPEKPGELLPEQKAELERLMHQLEGITR